jgi:hypothetical protein
VLHFPPVVVIVEAAMTLKKFQPWQPKKKLFPPAMLHRLLVTAALVLVVLAARRTSAEETESNPVLPLNSDFLITPTPILTPWQNGASAVAGSSTAVGASVGRLTYGPCVYRAAHWHNFAWEVLTPVTPAVSLTTVMQEPSNFGGLTRTDIVAPGQSVVFPAGWLHLQLNDNCTPLDAVLVSNAVNFGGTTNLPQAASTISPAYAAVAFVQPLPAPAPTNWVIDPACAQRCGINSTSSVSAGTDFKNATRAAAGVVGWEEAISFVFVFHSL